MTPQMADPALPYTTWVHSNHCFLDAKGTLNMRKSSGGGGVDKPKLVVYHGRCKACKDQHLVFSSDFSGREVSFLGPRPGPAAFPTPSLFRTESDFSCGLKATRQLAPFACPRRRTKTKTRKFEFAISLRPSESQSNLVFNFDPQNRVKNLKSG